MVGGYNLTCGTNLGDPSLKAKKASFGGLAGGFGPKSLRRGGYKGSSKPAFFKNRLGFIEGLDKGPL